MINGKILNDYGSFANEKTMLFMVRSRRKKPYPLKGVT